MNETQRKKRNFRNSKKWKEFRHRINLKQKGRCYISGAKLNKLSNLHHMNLNPDCYEDVTDEDNFVFLNHSMHEVVHALWRYYKDDETILERLEEVLCKMKQLNE